MIETPREGAPMREKGKLPKNYVKRMTRARAVRTLPFLTL
jgi:hypothetical protein